MKRSLYIALASILRTLQPDIADWARYRRWESAVRSIADELTSLRGFGRDKWLESVLKRE